MGSKAAETTCNISNTFGPGTANVRRVQWLFKKICKEDKSLEDKHSGQPTEGDHDQLRAITEAHPLSTPREVAKELNVNHSMVVQYLKQIGKVKKFGKLVPHEQTANKKKIIVLKCHLLLFYVTKMNHFLDQLVTCDQKWILYDNWRQPAQRLDREDPKHFPKSNLHQ